MFFSDGVPEFYFYFGVPEDFLGAVVPEDYIRALYIIIDYDIIIIILRYGWRNLFILENKENKKKLFSYFLF